MATNDVAAAVNEVVRERLVTAGAVDDTATTHGSDGLRIGAGDHVMTRLNNPDLGVANRMTWTVQAVTTDGSVQLHNAARRQHTTVDPDYAQHHLHLAYASTVHGVQGETADVADLILTDATDAAAAYVGLTRGRHHNTVHITADTLDQARQQWVQAAGRNRADLGLDQARTAALAEARNYAPLEGQERPVEGGAAHRGGFAERIAAIRDRLEQSGMAVVDSPTAERHKVDEYERTAAQQHRQIGPPAVVASTWPNGCLRASSTALPADVLPDSRREGR